MNRPNWDDFYIGQAFYIAQRSIDPRTKHAAIIVSKDGRPLSSGYNGPVKGIDDNNLQKYLYTNHKYHVLLHAEQNALLSYSGSHGDIQGATCYITGIPCNKCLISLIQKGIKRIVYGHVKSVMITTDLPEEAEAKRFLIEESGIEMIEHKNSDNIIEILESTINYFKEKKNG
jgi:dCMP deaminase